MDEIYAWYEQNFAPYVHHCFNHYPDKTCYYSAVQVT